MNNPAVLKEIQEIFKDTDTVEENLFMGKEITKKFGICDKKAMRKKAQEVMDKMGVSIPINAVMSDLSVGQQQMVEICKALMVDAKVLIMDEPTAALTQSETEGLFKLIKSLRKKGVSIVYISHRMEEIFELCDRITILRDGTYVGTEYIKDINMDDIVRMMMDVKSASAILNVKISNSARKCSVLRDLQRAKPSRTLISV